MSWRRFYVGMSVVGQGLWWLGRDKSLRKFVIIPLIIDLLLVLGVLFWALPHFNPLIASLLNYLPVAEEWRKGLSVVIWLVSFVAFVLLLVYSVFLVSVVVASPFNSLLAERALIERHILRNQPLKLGHWIGFSVRMLTVAILKALLFGVVGILLFVLALIPGLNLVAVVGFSLILAYDVMDYNYEVLGFGLAERLRHFRMNLDFFSGLALVLGLALLIPGLSLVLIPAAILGGAWNWPELNNGR